MHSEEKHPKKSMTRRGYLMESEGEAQRLDIKTDEEAVKRQALWAGIRPGMRVADIGSGSGRAASVLHELVQPGGAVVGIDASPDRIRYARRKYKARGLEFRQHNITGDLGDLETFDFVWVRFILEYFRKESFGIVKNISQTVRPGGTLCLIDLDHNSLNYSGVPKRLEKSIIRAVRILEQKANFDPFVGRKLYSFLYDLGYTDIAVDVSAHHLFYGEIRERDVFNWLKKIEVVSEKLAYQPQEYRDYQEFLQEFSYYLRHPRRFIYTPLIVCRGVKPSVNS